MRIVDRVSGETFVVEIIPVVHEDYRFLSKSRFWFNWKHEQEFDVYKLKIKESSDIYGLISLECHQDESRVEIRLLAVSRENRGKYKKYDHIAGNLIAFACKKAVEFFGEWACISLRPKTQLIDHYVEKYGMTQAGRSLFTDGHDLIELIQKYDYD